MQGNIGKQNEQSKNTNNQRAVNSSNQVIVGYHNNFPKISNNYSRYEPNSQPDRVNKQGVNVIQSTTRNPNSQQHGQNANNIAKNDKYYEPAPYTVVQSFAARLRYNQSKNEIPIVLNDPIHTTRQGFPTVLLEKDDYYVKLVAVCKYTLMGKFTNTIPKMELVRKKLYFTNSTNMKCKDNSLQC